MQWKPGLGSMICAILVVLITQTSPWADWSVVFHDDFDGTSIDTDAWQRYNSIGHDGNGARRPEAISISDGYCVITAQMVENTLVSGGMNHRSQYQYGKFEFRVRIETDVDEATSGVVLTWPAGGGWPEAGENDMWETGTSAGRESFSSFVHYGADNSQYSYVHEVDAKDWHVVAMEWEHDAICIFREDTLVWTLEDTAAIPDTEHRVCIQLDAFKQTMSGTVRMYVDWITIYQRTVASRYSAGNHNETADKSRRPAFTTAAPPGNGVAPTLDLRGRIVNAATAVIAAGLYLNGPAWGYVAPMRIYTPKGVRRR